MKVEEQKSLKEINKALQENVQLLPDDCQQQLRPSVDDLQKFTSEYEQLVKGLPRLLLLMFALIILFMALFGSFAYYSVKLEDTVAEKNCIIRQYQYHDSIYGMLLDMSDTTKYVYYRIRDGKPVTYHQLEHQYDSIQMKYFETQSENDHNQKVLELIHRLYPFEVKTEKNYLTVSGPNYKEQLEQAMAERDSLDKLCAKTQENYEVTKLKLELITKSYPIKVEQEGNRYYIVAPKVDSALLLLPHYRDKVTYDPDKNVWITTYTKEDKVN